MHVADFDAYVSVVVGEVFGHAFGEGGDEDAFSAGCAGSNFFEEIVDLVVGGSNFYVGVDESGGADDLFDDESFAFFEFVAGWGGADVDNLVYAVLEFVEGEGTVVSGAGEAESEFDEFVFA